LSSFPFALSGPEQTCQSRKFRDGSQSTMLGMSAGSTTVAPCAVNAAIASAITCFCSIGNPPRGFKEPPDVTAS
jgi:hypothetical protein